jgi:hypothetical protein
MSTNCVPILASLFKYSYEADFIEGILRENGKRLIKSFNLAYRILSPNLIDLVVF